MQTIKWLSFLFQFFPYMGNFSMNIMLNFKHIFYCPQLGMCKRYNKLVKILFQYSIKKELPYILFHFSYRLASLYLQGNQSRKDATSYNMKKISTPKNFQCNSLQLLYSNTLVLVRYHNTHYRKHSAVTTTSKLNINSYHWVTNLDFGRLVFVFCTVIYAMSEVNRYLFLSLQENTCNNVLNVWWH